MKRLTKRWGEEPYPNLAGKVVCEYKECDSAKSCNDCVHWRIAQRLAAIEDILGDEYDLDRLRVLVEMDSAGCILPCKIGDVFYRVCYGFDSSEIEKYRVSMVTQKADRSWRIRATDTESSFQIDWSLDDFSKRAYKTREEAEAALAKEST